MKLALLSLLLALPATAQDVPFRPVSTDSDQDMGGLQQNFRDLADKDKNLLATENAPGDKCLGTDALCYKESDNRAQVGANGIKFADGTIQTTAADSVEVDYSSASLSSTQTIDTNYTTITGSTVTLILSVTRAVECSVRVSLQPNTADQEATVRLCEGGTSGSCFSVGGFYQSPESSADRGTVSFSDSPATPSASGTHTFYLQARANSGTVDVKGNIATGRIRCLGITAR